MLRRLGEQLHVRYYDSLKEISPTNLSSVDLVVQLIAQEMKAEPIVLERRNGATQLDGISCGVFLLHCWEGEFRRFRSEGWLLLYPWQGGAIKVRKKTLPGLVSQILKFREEQAKQGGS